MPETRTQRERRSRATALIVLREKLDPSYTDAYVQKLEKTKAADRTAQNAEIGTETVTITCRETAIIFVSLCCVSRRIEAPTHLTETLLLLLLFFLLSVVLL